MRDTLCIMRSFICYYKPKFWPMLTSLKAFNRLSWFLIVVSSSSWCPHWTFKTRGPGIKHTNSSSLFFETWSYPCWHSLPWLTDLRTCSTYCCSLSSRMRFSKSEVLATCHDVLLQQPLQNNDLPLLQPFVARFTWGHQTLWKFSTRHSEPTCPNRILLGILWWMFFIPLNMKTLSYPLWVSVVAALLAMLSSSS